MQVPILLRVGLTHNKYLKDEECDYEEHQRHLGGKKDLKLIKLRGARRGHAGSSESDDDFVISKACQTEADPPQTQKQVEDEKENVDSDHVSGKDEQRGEQDSVEHNNAPSTPPSKSVQRKLNVEEDVTAREVDGKLPSPKKSLPPSLFTLDVNALGCTNLPRARGLGLWFCFCQFSLGRQRHTTPSTHGSRNLYWEDSDTCRLRVFDRSQVASPRACSAMSVPDAVSALPAAVRAAHGTGESQHPAGDRKGHGGAGLVGHQGGGRGSSLLRPQISARAGPIRHLSLIHI
eukprot:1733185-Rhodomonas_salina.3